MNLRTLVLPLLCGALFVADPLAGQDRPPETPSEREASAPPAQNETPGARDFVRFRDLGATPYGRHGRLETSVVTFEGEGGVVVDLIGAVHVADAAYYDSLELRFATYDKMLYEMIKPDGVEVVPGQAGGGMIGFLQRGLKETLELEFQLDAIDYRRPNFVHADLSPSEFFRLQKERSENFFTIYLRILQSELSRQQSGASNPFGGVGLLLAILSPDRAGALKWALAKELENMERLTAGLEAGRHDSVLVVERNKAALRKLRDVLRTGHKRVGIFYGAAHLPDMAARLRKDFGLRRGKVAWLTAWDIRRQIKRASSGPDGGEEGSPASEAAEKETAKTPR